MVFFELIKGTGEYKFSYNGTEYGPFPTYTNAVEKYEEVLALINNKVTCANGACDEDE